MSKEGFRELFIRELRVINDAKEKILKAFPRLIEAAESADLKEELTAHMAKGRKQLERLRDILRTLNEQATRENCQVMEDLIEEAYQSISQYPASSLRDAALISSAQRIAHYEMALYGALRTYAKLLDFDQAKNLLQTSLNEEGEANKRLTKIAEGGIFTSGINKLALR